jgi:hypothetical protein
MPITYEVFAEENRIETTFSGFLTLADYQGIFGPIAQLVKDCGQFTAIDIVDSYAGYDETLIDAFKPEDYEIFRSLSHLAVVSDLGWFCPVLANAPTDITFVVRSFPRNQLEQARCWTRNQTGIAMPTETMFRKVG